MDHDSYGVGWICALTMERAAAECMLDEIYPSLGQSSNDSNSYQLGRIGDHNVVITSLPAGIMGVTAAAKVAYQMYTTFPSLRFGLMVGIGGGAPGGESDIRLGDVVVSKPSGSHGGVVQYDFGKTVPGRNGSEFERTGALSRPSDLLLNAVRSLEVQHMLRGSNMPDYMSEMASKYPRLASMTEYPGREHDKLFESEYDHPVRELTCAKCCDHSRLVVRPIRDQNTPVVYSGLIASGNQVMRDAKSRDRLRSELNVLCFEMEAAGLMTPEFPVLVIRGICDYADSHKTKEWQPYSAVTAAAYAKELLNTIPSSRIERTRMMMDGVTKRGMKPVAGVGKGPFSVRQMINGHPTTHTSTLKPFILCYGGYMTINSNESPLGLVQSGTIGLQHVSYHNSQQRPSTHPTRAAGTSSILDKKFPNHDTRLRAGYAGELIEEAIDDKERQRQETFLLGLKVDIKSILEVKQKKGLRHRRTCEWIHEKEEYEQWRTKPGPQTLIIVAPPGRGKSVLAKYLVEKFATEESEDDTVILEFFCQDSPGLNNALVIIQSFLYQLLHDRRYLFKHVPKRTPRSISQEPELSFDILWGIFVDILFNSRLGTVICVLDGLDECDDDSQKVLVDALEKFSHHETSSDTLGNRDVRLLITSRDTEHARSIGLLAQTLHIQETDVDEDISRYIDDRIDKLTSTRKLPPNETNRVQSHLRDGAKGMFLWVSLSLDEFNNLKRGLSPKDVSKILQDLPRDVEGRYARAVQRIQDDPDKHDAKKLLEILLFSSGSLTMDEFAYLFASWPENCNSHSQIEDCVDYRFEYTARALCGSLIQETDGSIQLCHHTARQYLLNSSSDLGSFSFDWAECHSQLAELCLRYLLLEDIELPGVDQPADMAKFPLLEYALENWPLHLRCAEDAAIHRLATLLCGFFETKNSRFRKCLRLWSYWFDLGFPEHRVQSDGLILHALAYHNLSNVMKFVSFGDSRKDSDSFRLKLNTNLDARDENQATPLMMACYRGSLKMVQILLELGADASAVDAVGRGILHYAVTYENIEVLKLLVLHSPSLVEERDVHGQTPLFHVSDAPAAKFLIASGAEVNTERNDGVTPLYIAALNKNEALTRELIQQGSNVRHRSTSGFTPLSYAAQGGSSDIVSFLLQQKPLLHPEHASVIESLHMASQEGHRDALRILLEYGAKVDSKSSNDATALHFAAYHGQDDIVDLLVEAGATVSIKDDENKTPLHDAVQMGYLATAKKLIAWGADLNVASNFMQTPLSLASADGHSELARLLTLKGADVNAVTESGWTSLHYAARRGHLASTQQLLEAGANLAARNDTGFTALHLASSGGHLQVVNLLLENGADPETRTSYEWTSLHCAAQGGHLAVIERLRDVGASVTARISDDSTILHIASGQGHLHVVRWLIEANEDVNATDKEGRSPLLIALQSGHEQTAELLLESGANAQLASVRGILPLHEASDKGFLKVTERLLGMGNNPLCPNESGWTPFQSAVYSNHAEVVRALLKHTQNNMEAENATRAPLHLAARNGSVEMIRVLLEAGADPHGIYDPSGLYETTVYSAVKSRDLETVELFLAKGVDATTPGSEGSPLHLAARKGLATILDCLIGAGVPLDFQNADGMTPLCIATAYHHHECTRKLIAAGADPFKRDRTGFSALDWASRHSQDVKKIWGWELGRDSRGPETRVATLRKTINESLSALIPIPEDRSLAKLENTFLPTRCLMLLEDYNLASDCLHWASRKLGDYYSDYDCSMCLKLIEPESTTINICKTCIFIALCGPCSEKYEENREPEDNICSGHSFMEISEKRWKEMKPTDKSGGEKHRVVYENWFAELQEKYGGRNTKETA